LNADVKKSTIDKNVGKLDGLIRNVDTIKGVHPDLAVYIDPLRSVIVSTKERLQEAAVCDVGEYLVEQYSEMQNDFAARSPSAREKFREKLNQAGQEDALQSLWRQLEPLVKNKIPSASVRSILITGNLPIGERRNDEIQGLLSINGKKFPIAWADTTKEQGFRLSRRASHEINFDNENKIVVRLEADKIFGRTRFGGEINVDADKFFASMKLDGKQTRSFEFFVPIARDNDAESLNEINTVPRSSAHKVIVQLQVTASNLPTLKDLPRCLTE
jgi:hypothetical protein